MRMESWLAVGVILGFFLALSGVDAADRPTSKLVYPAADGKLTYQAYSAQGDTIPDFSNCGYGGGGVLLPDVPVRVTVQPEAGSGDDRARLQAAIDQVAAMPTDGDGFRGAVVLRRGLYRLSKPLDIRASGIVVRGEGSDEKGTVLLGTGKKIFALISVSGPAKPRGVTISRHEIIDAYAPVGGRSFHVADAAGIGVGDTVFVVRHGNADWIHYIGMDHIKPRPANPSSTRQWKPFDLKFDRVVTAIEGSRITVDAPIACAVDARWGGDEIVKFSDTRIEHVGVERLRADSTFDPGVTAKLGRKSYASDEDHAHFLVSFDSVKNAWVRDVVTTHMYHGVALFGRNSKWITAQDSAALDPVSEITGGRRYPFNIEGQLILVQRCYAREARHAFAVGARVPGPNVFLDCLADRSYNTSEPHQRWSVGGLFDNVQAQMAIQDRQWMGSGHGWAGANYVVWNSSGSLVCQRPPTAQNFSIGFTGKKRKGAFPRPDGYWESEGIHVSPRSLYLAQLQERLGSRAVAQTTTPAERTGEVAAVQAALRAMAGASRDLGPDTAEPDAANADDDGQ